MRLDGSVVAVTGATGGIGRALALALARAGARLVLAGRNAAALDAVSAGLPEGTVAATAAGDLAESPARATFAGLARAHDAAALVNLCGGNRFGLLEQQTEQDVTDLVNVNLLAPIDLTRRLLPHLQSRSEALVVNVGSAFGSIGHPGYALYCASKFGLRGFSEALARELSDGPVKVLHVAPRATRTAMNSAAATAMNAALGNAEDPPQRVAAQIVAAMQRGRRRTALGWRERCFAAVNASLPALVDRALAGQLATIKRFANPTSAPRLEEIAP